MLTTSNMARSILLNSSSKWKNNISSIWPMVVDYACCIFNHVRNKKGIVPIDVFTGTQVPRHKFLDIHT